jgi:hypothetical protein
VLSVTSTVNELTAPAVTLGTPLTASIDPASRAAAYTYVAGSAPWQEFDVTGVNTGGQSAAWFDPLVAYGRLDPLATSAGTLPSEVPPLFSRTFATTGGPFGHIMLSDEHDVTERAAGRRERTREQRGYLGWQRHAHGADARHDHDTALLPRAERDR